MIVTLRCQKCDKVDCDIARLYVPYDSLEGCTRVVDDELAARFHHAVDEVIPFMSMRRSEQEREDAERCLDLVYKAPVGRVLDAKGKALPRPTSESTPAGHSIEDMPESADPKSQEDTPSIDILSL